MMFISEKDKLSYKQALKTRCLSILHERIDTARQAMESAQEAANNEGKSSAGDKYETGRAMSQMDRDLSAGQMDEAIRDMQKLQSIDTERLYTHVISGAVVLSGDMVYFIAAGIGAIVHDGRKVIVLSPQAPLSSQLRGKAKGETVIFQTNSFQITDVF